LRSVLPFNDPELRTVVTQRPTYEVNVDE